MRRYEQARDAAVAQLDALERLLPPDNAAPVAAARLRLERGKFVLAVVGEFSSGKSFLLNALLGKFRYERQGDRKHLVGLLATDINPSTAAITELDYAPLDEAYAVYEDGRRERIPLDRLNRFIAVGDGDVGSVHEATADEKDVPIRVAVRTDSPFLERGFTVADTPGLASINPAHRRATLSFLPTADAVLYLIDTQQPFTQGDAAFLGLIRNHLDSIFIVQTKIDLWQEPQSDGLPAWEHAHGRIASLAAVHAPGTYVYALSAREYAEGTLERDAARIQASRFPAFLAALDASLIGSTGRARLRRALDVARRASDDARTHIARDLAMLALAPQGLEARRAEVEPSLVTLDARISVQRDAIGAARDVFGNAIDDGAAALAEATETQLSQSFDTADIARLRDRARLHTIVDRAIADVAGDFAERIADRVVDDLDAAAGLASDIDTLRFSLNDAAARALGADPGNSLWSGDVRAAIAATIVLDAIGGPAIALVHEIAMRFSSNAPGAYMKRELIADLRATIFPRMRAELSVFARSAAGALRSTYDEFAGALDLAAASARDEQLGSIERALAAAKAGTSPARCDEFVRRRDGIDVSIAGVGAVVEEFLAHDPEIAPADAGPQAVRTAHVDPSLDRALYDKGLRPQRWRVAVLGALRRGKSSLINAFAGAVVLDDDAAGSALFPIHVRYGQTDQAFALGDDGTWNEIDISGTVAAASSSPVLRLTPWKHPQQLVLVHAPAFDSGQAYAQEVNAVVAGASSAVLCLFSRQLSEVELALYERVAELGKPMLFAHTLADNETASERRDVVELAARYLRERAIPTPRIFTVSAQEYVGAIAAGRAPAPWNELGALIATIEGQAESHMARLARLERASADVAAAGVAAPVPIQKGGLLARLFGKGR
ncbi:MAG TPA: dynamin family protein [Candidatus Baltobacteraceae bacterium]